MSQLDSSLMMPPWAIPDSLVAQVTAARGRINGVGASAQDATDADRALVARFQFLNAAEKRAAEEAHAANRPLPAAVQARIEGRATTRPPAAPATPAPAAGTPAPAAPTPPSLADAVTIRNNELKTDYAATRARIEQALRTIRAQEAADKDKGEQAIRRPQEYANIYLLLTNMSQTLNATYGEMDTKLAAATPTAQQLQAANQLSDAFSARLVRQVESIESRSRNQRDPFDATKFFEEEMKPTILLASTTMGEMTRQGLDALVTGATAMANGVAGAVRDPQGTVDGVVAGARGAGNTFMRNLNPGTIGGGLIGGLGAFLISNMFGAGPIKWLLMLLLVPVGIMLGGSKLGGPINNMFSGMFGGRRRENGGADAPSTQVEGPTRSEGRDASTRDRDDTRGNDDTWSRDDGLPDGFRPMSRAELRGVVPASVARSTRYAPEGPVNGIFQTAYEQGYLRGQANRDGRDRIARGEYDYRDAGDDDYRDSRRDTRGSSRRDERRDERSDVQLEVRGNSYGVRTEYGSVRQYDGLRNPGWSMRPR